MTKKKQKSVSGTKEWSSHSVNSQVGCKNDCKYCYAKQGAARYKRIESEAEWRDEVVNQKKVNKDYRKVEGKIMYPTTHDVHPGNLNSYMTVLGKLLKAGNEVLIVSKPHLDCIRHICKNCEEYKEQILFRFSITAMDDTILAYWEPNAPKFPERLASLKEAFDAGYQTSVSMEPMLDSANAVDLVNTLKPFVTDSIWIGKMNRISVVDKSDVLGKQMELAIRRGQTDPIIKTIYNKLKNEPLVKWKESIKKVVGIQLATKVGQDI